jgi:hypothetical protein
MWVMPTAARQGTLDLVVTWLGFGAATRVIAAGDTGASLFDLNCVLGEDITNRVLTSGENSY